MSEGLNIKKRVTSINIEDMKPKEVEVDGKQVRLCLNCGKIVPTFNRKYCSLTCSNEFFAKHNQRGLREYVYRREHGRCQICGFHNPKAPSPPPKPRKPGWVDGGYKAYQKAMVFYEKALEDYKKEYLVWKKTVYEEWIKANPQRVFVADHIVPIALGGNEFDPNNVQLLCDVCNKKKTAKDQTAIGKKRKLIKRVGKNVKPLSQFFNSNSSEKFNTKST
jgi:5-methylcytosine-specific restriction endonuclease McrA